MQISRKDVERRILAGENLIIYREKVVRVTEDWLGKHPGGSLVLLHYVGRDATDEIDAYHSESALGLLSRYIIGSAELDEDGLWRPFLPPISTGWARQKDGWVNESTMDPSQIPCKADKVDSLCPSVIQVPSSDLCLKAQSEHSLAYRRLHQRIIDSGLYTTPYLSGYGVDALRCLFLVSLSIYAYCKDWVVLSAFFLGVSWHQLVFWVHDSSHTSFTHNWAIDKAISTLIADFVGGLSVSWWVSTHNVHHLVCNVPGHDPDIQYLPFFAISPQFFKQTWSTYYKRIITFDQLSAALISIQHKMFYFVLFFARFNLYFLAYGHLLKSGRPRANRWTWYLEIVCLIGFWTWYPAVLYGCGSWFRAALFLLVSNVTPAPLHVQLVLSHFSMSTEDLGPVESFPQRQMRTTCDVKCHPYLQFLHGGLHLQVTHHLFPRLPKHNLMEASKLVKEFAAEQGLEYHEFGSFVHGNYDVLGVLKGVADQVKIMGKVASAETREAVINKITEKDRLLRN